MDGERSEWLEIARTSWVYTGGVGQRLHHLAISDDDAGVVATRWCANGVASCGLRAEFYLPGLVARMGMERCARCCDKLGWPRGTGSPKNDPDLRIRLGLDPARPTERPKEDDRG